MIIFTLLMIIIGFPISFYFQFDSKPSLVKFIMFLKEIIFIKKED